MVSGQEYNAIQAYLARNAHALQLNIMEDGTGPDHTAYPPQLPTDKKHSLHLGYVNLFMHVYMHDIRTH